MSSQTKFRVAICGGGIAGLTLAVALSAYPDIQVDVYERAAEYTEVGAGVGMWWRPRRVLASMGLELDLAQIVGHFEDTRIPSINYRKADQREGHHFATLVTRGGLATLHRPEFQTVLLRRLSSRVNKYTSKRLTRYSQPGNTHEPIRLAFSDGTQAVCDVLIGADGIKSAVRAGMMQAMAVNAEGKGNAAEAAALRDCIHPRFSGAVAYRVVLPAERLAAVSPRHRALSAPYQYLGKDKHLMAYPISHGRLINVAVFTTNYAQEGSSYSEPWTSQADPRELTRLFAGWESEVEQLVACMEGLSVSKWVVNVVRPLPAYNWGRIVLLGDAAHACTPFQGAGAGNAIEDAHLLATLLGHRRCTRSTLPRVLQIYTRARQPATQRVAELSRRNGMLFAFYHAPPTLSELAHQLQKCFDDTQEGDPLDDVRRAIEKLESS